MLPAAYGGHKDVSAAWAAGVLAVGTGPAAGAGPEGRERSQTLEALGEERAALIVYDGTLLRAPAVCLAWAGLPLPGKRGEMPHSKVRPTA